MFVKLFRNTYKTKPKCSEIIQNRDSDYGEILIDIQCFDPCIIIENYIQ